MYADADGHIFYLAGGRIPARESGDFAFWSGIVPGESSQTLWTKTLPVERLPQALDPPSGWLQNANDPPWSVTDPPMFAPEQFPSWMSPRSLSFRAQRSLKMIEAEKFDLEGLAAAKLSTRSELADRILDELIAAARAHGGAARRAAEVLSAWDRNADPDSRGAVLFFAWADKFLGKPAWTRAWSKEHARTTPDGIADPSAAATLLATTASEIEGKFGALDVPFGDVYRLRWAGGVDFPANGASGKYGVFRVTDYQPDPDGKLRAFQGDSFVLLVEFSDPPRALALLSYGNASEPTSPHVGDQLRMYSQKRLRPVWRTREEIGAHQRTREALR
jgi:acyl-homoserine-lactone acylase